MAQKGRQSFDVNWKFTKIIFRMICRMTSRAKIPQRHTRLLKLRPARGSGVDDGDREPRTASRRKVQKGRLVVKQLAHTGDSPPVTNSTWIHTRHVRQIQTSLMSDEKNEWDFPAYSKSTLRKEGLFNPRAQLNASMNERIMPTRANTSC